MRYHLSGERVDCDIPLDGLLGAPQRDDALPATLVIDQVARLRPGAFDQGALLQRIEVRGEPWLSVARLKGAYLMRAHGCADFALDPHEPGRVSFAVTGSADHPQLAFFVVNRVLPFTLALRDRGPLHASAVVREGVGAVAFVGDPGAGKSTLAAALCPPLTFSSDDCVVFDCVDGGVIIQPSHGMARLRADSLAKLDDGVAPTTRAKGLLPRDASTSVQPLSKIYALDPGAMELGVEPMSVRDAVVELARHVFRVDPSDKRALARELPRLEQLARHVPVVRLRFSHRLDRLSELCHFVAADIEKLPPVDR